MTQGDLYYCFAHISFSIDIHGHYVLANMASWAMRDGAGEEVGCRFHGFAKIAHLGSWHLTAKRILFF